jgi:hypothetical protein
VQRGDGRWQIHIRHTDEDGRSRRYTVYGSTPKEARAEPPQSGNGCGPTCRPGTAKSPSAYLPLGGSTQRWRRPIAKQSTKAMYATMARQHIIGSKIGGEPLDKLRPSHIEAWKVELEDRGLSESTIRSAYTILRACSTPPSGIEG